jgi:hypothetical protein
MIAGWRKVMSALISSSGPTSALRFKPTGRPFTTRAAAFAGWSSKGSSVGYITLVHDAALRAGGFFHVSTYFADVVSQGMTTTHVWESLRHHVTVDELRDFWAPVSPMPYVERGLGAGKNAFMVYGKYDPTFLPELTAQMLAALRQHGANLRTLELHCGHYSLELPPFSHIAGYRMLTFLRSALAQ